MHTRWRIGSHGGRWMETGTVYPWIDKGTDVETMTGSFFSPVNKSCVFCCSETKAWMMIGSAACKSSRSLAHSVVVSVRLFVCLSPPSFSSPGATSQALEEALNSGPCSPMSIVTGSARFRASQKRLFLSWRNGRHQPYCLFPLSPCIINTKYSTYCTILACLWVGTVPRNVFLGHSVSETKKTPRPSKQTSYLPFQRFRLYYSSCPFFFLLFFAPSLARHVTFFIWSAAITVLSDLVIS